MPIMVNLKLTAAQVSALECAGLDLDDSSPKTTAAWSGGRYLTFDAADADALFSELNELSNGEDLTAQAATDPVQKRQAAGAAVALGNLASKVLMTNLEGRMT